MSILAKYNKAMNDKDEAALRDRIHDDYTFTMHKSGTVLKKDDVVTVSYTHLTLPTK